ncbi:TPA: hypothetical protein ACGUT2_002629, partial [Staphylococcus aureus]
CFFWGEKRANYLNKGKHAWKTQRFKNAKTVDMTRFLYVCIQRRIIYSPSRNDGRYIEIIGISIGGGTIKIKGIHINGLEVDLNHGLPILVVDGNMTKAQVNHFINDINDMKLDCKDEFIKIDEDKCLVVIPLNKAISESTLNTIKEKYSDVNVSYIN